LRIPDISFISSTDIPADWPPLGYVEVVPSLIIEVVSPGNSAAEIRRRIRDYIGAGVSMVWVIWPDDHSVSVHAETLNSIELQSDDVLDGGEVLPGFSVRVADLFDIAR
jgi:Uma2 family endonuclease